MTVSADTIGDTLDNSTLTYQSGGTNGVPKVVTSAKSFPGAVANQQWSMYQMPGLGRKRTPSEGSFVKWGYSWPTVDANAMQMSADVSAGTQQAVSNNSKAWNNMTTASPIGISFNNTNGSHGAPYFSLNYVDNDDLVDFGKQTSNAETVAAIATGKAWAGQTMTAAQQDNVFNPSNVSSKMKNNNGKLQLAPGESFNGGFLQATGNVPIQAAVANGSQTTVDAIMAGNWAVMVKVKVAEGIDAKAFAASIDWNKSYFFLSFTSIPYDYVIGQTSVDINFPAQFDHHVYLNPEDSQSFFLKVKAIPFWFNQEQSQFNPFANNHSQLQLQDGNADYVDYLHNRMISGGRTGSAQTLDNMVGGKKVTTLNDDDSSVKKTTGGNVQPNFQDISTVTGAIGNLWSLYDLIPPTRGKSAVYEAGLTGQMISLINSISGNAIESRSNGDSLFSGIITSLVNYFGKNTFQGSAHINFSFDISKYSVNTTKKTQSLTAGKFFAAPNTDGNFNTSANGMGETDAVQISLYDSTQLVDPYGVTRGISRTDPKAGNILHGIPDAPTDPMRKALNIKFSDQSSGKTTQSGMTPADYAIIKADQRNKGLRYPVYTNYTSWTGAIVPYDRMHWNDGDDTGQASYTDTLHSDGKIGSDINNRTATPDPANDGILANSGNAFILKQQADYRSAAAASQPVFTNGKLTTAGLINPERYANVYQLYDYTKSTPTVDVHVADYATDKPQVTASTGTNLTGTSITSNLDGQKWHYTGAMDSGNGLPLADATVNLQQTFKPTLNLSNQKLLMVAESEATDKHWVRQLGTWRDPLGIAQSDSLVMDFDGLSSQQRAMASTLGGNTDSHTVTGDWSTLNKFDHDAENSAEMVVDASQNVTAKYQLPVAGNPNDNFFYGSGTLNRDNKNVKIANGYTLASGVDATATDNYYLLLDRDSPTDQWYTAQKEFTVGNKTIHYLQKGDDLVHVKVTVTHKEGSKLPTGKDLIIRIPNVQQDKSHVGATIPKLTATANDAGNSVTVGSTGEPTDNWLTDNFTSWKLSFAMVPQKFTYEYDYKIVNQSNIPLLT
ncbi:hypothetical protein [Schleiferilactobacillus perolens]|uniref:hypothetical protein n=1 Tax=Schleiferilactobacillus perolens TaxID=100468 RepID=UPI0012EE86F0|nr:hypothetical protein [Schleiferilactobacillus perolens]